MAALHARIVAEETGAAVFDAQSPCGVFLNFDRVEGRAALHDGDMLRLGPPHERESVMIQMEFGGELAEPRAASAALLAGDAGNDRALLAQLSAADDDFLLAEEPTAPAPTPEAPVPAAPVVVDEFFVVAEPEPAPATPLAAPASRPAPAPAPADEPPFVGDSDFALPSFDLNWSGSAPSATPVAPAADEFFLIIYRHAAESDIWRETLARLRKLDAAWE